MIISKLRCEWTYIVGRVAAMTSRPLMLLTLKHWGGNELAAIVAVAFLLVMLTSAVSAFDCHRGFYQAYFRKQRTRGLPSVYRQYCSATTLQAATVIPLLFGFVAYRFGDLMLATLVTVYFASERLADEAQRFLIFKGQRDEWGTRILTKALLQMTGVSACVVFLGSAALHATIGLLLAGNLIAYGTKLSWRYLPIYWPAWNTGAKACLNQPLFWVLSIITTSISYLDRVVVMLFQQSDMAAYTILVSCMSIIQNAIEYFFLSLRRQDILRGQLTPAEVFFNPHFYIIIGFSAVFGTAASWAMLGLYHGRQIDNLELLPIVLLSQAALSVSLVFREILYWNNSVARLVWHEAIFLLCAVTAAVIIRSRDMGYEVALGIISFLFILRMCLLIWSAARTRSHSSLI